MTVAAPTRRSIHGWLRRMGRILAWAISILVVLFALALLAGARARSDLKARYPPPGQLVDIGGYRLHIDCRGTGSPTVVMDAGLAESSLTWVLVQPHIAAATRVCVYDRAGLGWSDPSPNPRTAEPMVAELHSLLAHANISGPYVMVGHSTGGMLVRLFAHNYPSEVAGMVLVDAQHEAQFERLDEPDRQAVEQAFARAGSTYALLRALATTGVGALYPAAFADATLPSPAREASAALLVTEPSVAEAKAAETSSTFASLAEVRNARITTLGNVPLVVISRGIFGGSVPDMSAEQEELWWQGLQADLLALSSQSQSVLAERSGHYIQLDQPQLVIDAITQVLSSLRR